MLVSPEGTHLQEQLDVQLSSTIANNIRYYLFINVSSVH